MLFHILALWITAPPWQGLPRPPAYLDPGSGSFILQLLIAALLGAAFLLKTYWGRVKLFFRRLFKKDDQQQHDEP